MKEDYIELIRINQNDCRTIGALTVNNQMSFFTLEPPWIDNKKGLSCIPEGTYKFEVYESKKYQRTCIALFDVPERNRISIHPGNFVRETKGCIMPGCKMMNTDDVGDSRDALNKILMLLNYGHGKIKIARYDGSQDDL